MQATAFSRINVWTFQDLTAELRHNTDGASGSLTAHAHADYQILISEHFTGRYDYRGASHIGSVRTLAVFHPGEIHAACGVDDAQPLLPLRSLFVAPHLLRDIQSEALQRRTRESPFFEVPILDHTETFSRMLSLHRILERPASMLEREAAVASALTFLISHHTSNGSVRHRFGMEHKGVRLVQEYLDAHATEKISLQQLADVADLSPFHLCRVFRRHVGLPMQQYQMQARVNRARQLLLSGVGIAETAIDTGFADQSHLTREFRKLIGVPPGRYLPTVRDGATEEIAPNSKIVQDSH